jgi:hypothetical protein
MKCTTAVKADNEITKIGLSFFVARHPLQANGGCRITVPNMPNFST